MARNSETITKIGIQKVVGWYESNEINTLTDLVEGDVIGRTAAGEFGKFEATAYPVMYGIAYEDSALGIDGVTRKCLAIIGGEVNRAFVRFPATPDSHEVEVLLRDKAIYLR